MYTNDCAVLTEEYRGDLLDLIHEGYICVVDETGRALKHAGNPDAMVYYRSASKPLQALPVIAMGLDEKYGLDRRGDCHLLRLSSGEPFHVDAITSIARKAGLDLIQLDHEAHRPRQHRRQRGADPQGTAPRKDLP